MVKKHGSGKWRRKENTKSSPRGQAEQGEVRPKLRARPTRQQYFSTEATRRRDTVTAVEKLFLFPGRGGTFVTQG